MLLRNELGVLGWFYHQSRAETMFMQRLITTLILAPLVLLGIFLAPAWLLGGVLVIILLMAGFESFKLIPLTNVFLQGLFLALLLLAFWASSYVYNAWLTIGLVFWLFNCVAILSFPNSQDYWGYPVVVCIACLVLLPLFAQSLIHLYKLPRGKALIVYLLFLIWASDIGAYLTGKKWGLHKLIPQVSPGKSWEGVAGGFGLAMVVALIGHFCFQSRIEPLWFILSFITVLISIFGDLFISILKRRCHLKDTGNIIPGHGGILDRLDSLIAALPVFYFGLTLIRTGY
jgi:phosphatidate cytidylyltransferase